MKNILDDSSHDVTTNSMALISVDGDDDSPPKSGSKSPIIGNATDGQVFQMLKTQIEKQRDDIKLKDRELNERNTDIENVSFFVNLFFILIWKIGKNILN